MSLFSSLIGEDVLGRAAAQPSAQAPVAKREVFIAIRKDGKLGDGTRLNPYDGSIRDRLDGILNGNFDNSLRSPVRFVFGPGIFRTSGSARNGEDPNQVWTRVWPGQEFVGAGMFATTLKLEIPNPKENLVYGVFGNQPWLLQFADDVVVSDMTVDCDLQNQPPTPPYDYPRIMVSCAGLTGSRIRFKRVRVINAGTHTPYFDYGYVPPPNRPDNGLECFPVAISAFGEGGTPHHNNDCTIEDCVVEQPFHSNGRETTCIHIGGGGISDTGPVTNNHAQLRNCLVDCAQTNGDSAPQIPVESLVFEALQARLSTLTQHDLRQGDRVRIRGAGALDNVYLVSGDPLDQWNVLLVFAGTPAAPTGDITAQKLTLPAMRVQLQLGNPIGKAIWLPSIRGAFTIDWSATGSISRVRWDHRCLRTTKARIKS